jgi:hypothetical protein
MIGNQESPMHQMSPDRPPIVAQCPGAPKKLKNHATRIKRKMPDDQTSVSPSNVGKKSRWLKVRGIRAFIGSVPDSASASVSGSASDSVPGSVPGSEQYMCEEQIDEYGSFVSDA